MRVIPVVALAALVVPLAVLSACSKEAAKPTGQGTAASAETPEKEPFGRMTVDEVAAKIADAKAGKAPLVVVDNNAKGRFDQGHVPGAKWLSFTDIRESDLPADKNTTLVFYCSNER